MLVCLKRLRHFQGLKLKTSDVTFDPKAKNNSLPRIHLRLSKKASMIITIGIIVVIFVSLFALLPKPQLGTKATTLPQSSANPLATTTTAPTSPPKNNENPNSNAGQTALNVTQLIPKTVNIPKTPGLIETSQTVNTKVWNQTAANAWSYFQPNIGVDNFTGLPYAADTFTEFTDWDLGVYIQAVIDAQKLNLTTAGGDWGSSARLEKVITFLETRPLNNYSYPYQFYDATTGNYSADSSNEVADWADTGRLFVALNNLRNFNTSFANRINNIVLNGTADPNGGSNYAALVPGILNSSLKDVSTYSYYVYSGYASFFPSLASVPNRIMTNILSNGTVTTYGNVSLPNAAISCDPLLCSVFELNNSDPRLLALMQQVYLAHEAYAQETGVYQAFSEGNSPANGFLWEWVVLPNGVTWAIQDQSTLGTNSYLGINAVVYNKVAISFLALYNSSFARNLVIYLERALPEPEYGYYDGVDNSGVQVMDLGSNTNGLILDAATYAIVNGSLPNPQ